MNKILGFIFLISMYFGLNEANGCYQNKLEIQNKLGPNRILKIRCDGSPDIHWLKFNENYLFPLRYAPYKFWMCQITHWPTKQPYIYDLNAKLGPKDPPCMYGFRSWIAKVDGVYYEHNKIKPAKRLLGWTKEGTNTPEN
ncbi:unnamed protein product [Arabidopsis halleri]